MSALALIRQLWQHKAWADAELERGLGTAGDTHTAAWREYAHMLGADEVWLSRIQARTPRAPVWPDIPNADVLALCETIRHDYHALLAELGEQDVQRVISYCNSHGQPFDTPLGDILVHVALHAQYHRGKVNLLLRQQQAEPAPGDFISFVRGVPAATQRKS